MPHEPNVKPFPDVAHRPFPWRCHNCLKKDVRLSIVQEYEATLWHDGKLHTFLLHDIELPQCAFCGAVSFTEDVDQQVRTAFRRRNNLLLPSQIKSAIDQLGVANKKVSDYLGVKEEALESWLNGSQIQSLAMDAMLRAYFSSPPSLSTAILGDLGKAI